MKIKCDHCDKIFKKLPSAIKRTKHNFCSQSCAGIFNNTGKIRGPYKHNGEGRHELYEKARELRKLNYGYKTIATLLKSKVSWQTIRNWTSNIHSDKEKSIQISAERRQAKSISELRGKDAIRKFLIKKRGYKCEECKRKEWQNNPIPIEVHHIDGNKKNNTEENLQLLCLNCHALTPTFRNKKRPQKHLN